MVEDVFNFLLEQLKHNSFLTGGGALMGLGAIGASMRKVPGNLWTRLKSCLIMEVEVTDRDPAFLWLAQWLAAQPYSKRRARRLSITTVKTSDDTGAPGDRANVILTPAPGTHYFRFKGRWISLHRQREESGGGMSQSSSVFPKETFRLCILTRRRDLVCQLIEEARRIAEPPEDDRRTIYTYRKYSGWCASMKRRPRAIESVVLVSGLIESIIADIKDFQSKEQWYIERGIPYRRTYLFYGPPGTGKSSAVWAIASHLKMNLAVVNLAAKSLSDDDLRESLSDMAVGSVGLIEDIDCVFQERKSTDDNESHVTFSGLLNALDGVASGEGRIMFMTTNHRERLDPALLRPGRCDVHFEVGNADSSQILRMFDRFFPEATSAQAMAFVDQIPPGKVSTAAIQGILLQCQNDISLAIKNAEGLCTN